MRRTAARRTPVVPPRIRGIFFQRQLGAGVTLRSEPNRVVQVRGRYPVTLLIRGKVFFFECDAPIAAFAHINGAILTSSVTQLVGDTNAGIRQGLLCHPESGLSIYVHAPEDIFEQVDDLTKG